MHEMSSWCLFWLHLNSFYGILYKLLIFLFCENIFVNLQKDFFLYTVSRKHFGFALFWTSKNNICICCEDKNRYPLSIHDMNLSISIKSIQIQVMHKHIPCSEYTDLWYAWQKETIGLVVWNSKTLSHCTKQRSRENTPHERSKFCGGWLNKIGWLVGYCFHIVLYIYLLYTCGVLSMYWEQTILY